MRGVERDDGGGHGALRFAPCICSVFSQFSVFSFQFSVFSFLPSASSFTDSASDAHVFGN
jgi:hypothetical protein